LAGEWPKENCVITTNVLRLRGPLRLWKEKKSLWEDQENACKKDQGKKNTIPKEPEKVEERTVGEPSRVKREVDNEKPAGQERRGKKKGREAKQRKKMAMVLGERENRSGKTGGGGDETRTPGKNNIITKGEIHHFHWEKKHNRKGGRWNPRAL